MFDAQKFLTCEVGSPQHVLRLFALYGLSPPQYETAQKWYTRGSIPGDWLALLLSVLELDRGEPMRLAGYIKERREHA